LAKEKKDMLRNHLINIHQDPKGTGVRADKRNLWISMI
jgi:hypothetical protein